MARRAEPSDDAQPFGQATHADAADFAQLDLILDRAAAVGCHLDGVRYVCDSGR
jgi:hypothetical protein